MKRKIFQLIIRILSRVSNKRLLYSKNFNADTPMTAAKSKFGFWYCGDIFNSNDLAYGVAVNGEIESEGTDLMRTLTSILPENYVMYDIGANTGWYSCLIANDPKSSRVYAFEPLEEFLGYLSESVIINQTSDKIKLVQIALSNKTGKEHINLAGTGSGLSDGFLQGSFKTKEIMTDTLDSLVTKNKYEAPHLIKIDVEGHEYKTLLGSQNTLSVHKPVLYVEIAKSFKNNTYLNKHYSEIFIYMKSLGYKSFLHKGYSLVQHSETTTSVPEGVHMYLFVHESSQIIHEKTFKHLLSS